MTRKRFIATIVILVAVIAGGLVLCARTTFLVHSASAISRHLLGYELAVDSFIFSPTMKAEMAGLTLSDIRRGTFISRAPW